MEEKTLTDHSCSVSLEQGNSVQKTDISMKFQEMAHKLGWFEYGDLNKALKTLSKSSKKKSSKPRTQQGKEAGTPKKQGKENKCAIASRSKQNSLIYSGDNNDVTPPLSELNHHYTAQKLSFTCDSPQKESTHDELSKENSPDSFKSISVRASKGCTDLTRKSKSKSRYPKSKTSKQTPKSMICTSSTLSENTTLSQPSRFSFCPDDIGDPLVESTRIHSRESVERMLDFTCISVISSTTNMSDRPAIPNNPSVRTQEDTEKSSPWSSAAVTNIYMSGEDRLCEYLDKLTVNNHHSAEINSSYEESYDCTEHYTTAVCNLTEERSRKSSLTNGKCEGQQHRTARNNKDSDQRRKCSSVMAGSCVDLDVDKTDSLEAHLENNLSYVEVQDASSQASVSGGSANEVTDSPLLVSLDHSDCVGSVNVKQRCMSVKVHCTDHSLTSEKDPNSSPCCELESESSLIEIQDASVQTSTLSAPIQVTDWSVSEHRPTSNDIHDMLQHNNYADSVADLGRVCKSTSSPCKGDSIKISPENSELKSQTERSEKSDISVSQPASYEDTNTNVDSTAHGSEKSDKSTSLDSSYIDVMDNSLQTSHIDYDGNTASDLLYNSKTNSSDSVSESCVMPNKESELCHMKACERRESKISNYLEKSECAPDLHKDETKTRTNNHAADEENTSYYFDADSGDTIRAPKEINNDGKKNSLVISDNATDSSEEENFLVSGNSKKSMEQQGAAADISDTTESDGKGNTNTEVDDKEYDKLGIFKLEYPKPKVISLSKHDSSHTTCDPRQEKSTGRLNDSVSEDDSLPDLAGHTNTPVLSSTHWRTSRKYDTDSSDDDFEAFLERMKTPSKKQEQKREEMNLKGFIVSDSDVTSGSDDELFHVNTDRAFVPSPRKKKCSDSSDEDNVFKPVKEIKRKNMTKERNKLSDWSEDKPLNKHKFLKSLTTDLPDELCDREARRFVKNFKKEKETLTRRLFELYNESIFEYKLPKDLNIKWNNRLLRTAGYCVYKRNAKIKDSNSVRVELSTKVCDSAERVRDTLIHELCHAAVWLLHGKNDGHGPYWKYWARKANQVHPEIPVISRCHDYSISTKFTYQCSQCGYSIGRHSKSLDTTKKVCGYCHGQFVLLSNIGTRSAESNGTLSTPATPRTPNKFALFVKENYGEVKKRDKNLKHGEVMRLLSKDFAEKNKI